MKIILELHYKFAALILALALALFFSVAPAFGDSPSEPSSSSDSGCSGSSSDQDCDGVSSDISFESDGNGGFYMDSDMNDNDPSVGGWYP